MIPYTVILADPVAGKNEQGYPLVWFLETYYGKNAVQVLTRETLSEATPTEHMFVFFPTSLTPEELKTLSYTHLYLGDYGDDDHITYDVEPFQHQAVRYFKQWTHLQRDYPLPIGVLPIKFPTSAYRLVNALSRSTLKRPYDMFFLGMATDYQGYHQRLEWLREVHDHRGDLRYFGGLFDKGNYALSRFTEIDPKVYDLKYHGKPLTRLQFSFKLATSKIALAPAGHGPWSYRHYEAMLCRCIVVSNDLTHVENLIPFPKEGMKCVADHASVIDAVREVLENPTPYLAHVESNVAHLNRYLKHGAYSKDRPELLARFEAQLA